MRSVIFAVSTALTVLLSACTGAASSVPVNTVSSVSASTSITTSSEVDSAVSESASSETGNIQTGLVREQTLDSTEGLIHYSYYLPEDYDPTRKYPMMVVMPGYNMMWFGESSSGSNLDWTGFTSWTNLGQDMIVVSAQLTDWGDTSARQAIALTEYFINHFAVDTARIYAAGYSAGGETMSRAVAMRPDLYAAYLHGASQWDGGFAPIAENGVAVYIYMAQGDEYYGVQKARNAYNGLHDAYAAAGWTDEQIDTVLQMQTPDKADTGLFYFKGNPGAKFSTCNAGGAFAYVGAMQDSFPHALELSRKKYNAFALIYRPGAQTACEDLARAIAFVFTHAEELEVDTSGYSLWGGSAGARMAAWLGSYGTASFGEQAYPQPGAVIMQYTGLGEVYGNEPPTYACVGDRDYIADERVMRWRIETIRSQGTPAEIEVFPGLAHGFGLGTGTSAEGWLDHAVAFWEENT